MSVNTSKKKKEIILSPNTLVRNHDDSGSKSSSTSANPSISITAAIGSAFNYMREERNKKINKNEKKKKM
jgi:hypothetical protein